MKQPITHLFKQQPRWLLLQPKTSSVGRTGQVTDSAGFLLNTRHYHHQRHRACWWWTPECCERRPRSWGLVRVACLCRV